MCILAFDLGQSKSAFAFGGPEGIEQTGFIRTSDAELRALITRLAPRQVVMEICPLAARVHDLVLELGLSVIVADTTQDAWKWRNVKGKSGRDDALKLLRLALVA